MYVGSPKLDRHTVNLEMYKLETTSRLQNRFYLRGMCSIYKSSSLNDKYFYRTVDGQTNNILTNNYDI